MALKTRLALLIAAALFLAPAARAQFIGFTSPQTVTQVAFTAQSCAAVNGAGGAFFQVKNIGQSVHYVLYQTTGTITSLSVEIQGSRDGSAGSFFRISETANAITAGGVTADIYLPIVRIAITACTGSGSISATYTGTSVANGPPQGIFTSSGTYNKDVAVGLPANVSATFTVPLPNGGTGGAVYFKYSAATCAGSSLVVTAGPDQNHQVTILASTAIANVATTQAFTVAAIPATIATVTYTSGCAASAATYDLSFSVGERIVTANVTAIFNGGGGGAPPAPVEFSCNRQAPISVTFAGPGTVKVVTAIGPGSRIHVCHVSMSDSAAANITLSNGSGVNCATGLNSMSGPYQNVATLALDFGWWASLIVPTAGDDFCITSSAAMVAGGVVVYADF